MTEPKIYFSDFYNVSPMIIESYGAFNISLLSDLPLFIDPFLLFNSTKSEYQELHKNIIKYLKFLKEKANSENDKGFIKYYYRFSEVGQNWLGFSASGNAGSALGNDFANNLNENLHSLFADFGKENVTKGSHLEKLCLISKGVGRDNISDFTTNLIKEFLLEYTQTFAKKYIYSSLCREFKVPKVKFNYETESWEDGKYYLPYYGKDFVILTPKDILTKDDIWINKKEMSDSFDYILSSLADDELRAKLNNYLIKMLGSGNPDKKKVTETKAQAYGEFPDLIDFYIRYKEDNGDNATEVSSSKVKESEYIYLDQFGKLASKLLEKYPSIKGDSYQETMNRVNYFKQVIEDKDGYKLLYDKNGNQLYKEQELQILFRFVCNKTPYDINREPSNGRGKVDYTVSLGSADKTLLEFKLASNKKLPQNLKNQVEVYKKANDTNKAIKVIFYFTESELNKVNGLLKDLDIENSDAIILVDCRSDNKISASNVK